jgi:5'(3')-deoxyribonucleotidase
MRTLALDVDAVLAETHKSFLELYNDRYGTDYSLDDITYWDWPIDEFGYEKFHNMTDNLWQKRWRDISVCEPNISRKVSKLSESFEVHIVTARSGCDDSIRTWLDFHDIVEFKSFNTGVKNKADKNYDCYIDDNPNMIGQIGDGQILFLKSRNWNSISQKQNVEEVQSIVDSSIFSTRV